MIEEDINILSEYKDLLKFILWTSTIDWRLYYVDLHGDSVTLCFARPDQSGSCRIEAKLNELNYNKLKNYIPNDKCRNRC